MTHLIGRTLGDTLRRLGIAYKALQDADAGILKIDQARDAAQAIECLVREEHYLQRIPGDGNRIVVLETWKDPECREPDFESVQEYREKHKMDEE